MPTNLPFFPTYLLPSISFPRPSFRHHARSSPSVSSSLSTTSPALSSSPISPLPTAQTTPSSSPPDTTYFAHAALDLDATQIEDDESAVYTLHRAHPDVLRCSTCATDLAFSSQIVSKGFTGRHGRAYLLSAPDQSGGVDKRNGQRGDLINTLVGKPVTRQLATGVHVVADISCAVCGSCVGWKYVDAREPMQRYKIGKFILETQRAVGVKGWEDAVMGLGEEGSGGFEGGDGAEREEEEVLFDSEDEDECEELFAGTWDRETVSRRRGKRAALQRKREGSLL